MQTLGLARLSQLQTILATEKIKKRIVPSPEVTKSEGIGGDHLAWNIIVRKLDYQSQMKMSQQNQRLAELIRMNAESDLRKFRRHIQENKYMYVTKYLSITSPII